MGCDGVDFSNALSGRGYGRARLKGPLFRVDSVDDADMQSDLMLTADIIRLVLLHCWSLSILLQESERRGWGGLAFVCEGAAVVGDDLVFDLAGHLQGGLSFSTGRLVRRLHF